MKTDLALTVANISEIAALAAFKWIGKGDSKAADAAAVEAMRKVMNQTEINGEIIIGEGEIDEAPMLHIEEKVGLGYGPDIDIAVDPIDGTRMVAMGQDNAISVIAVTEKNGALKAPDMYMEKIATGPETTGIVSLEVPLIENLKNIAKALNKPLNQLVVATLAKPRHSKIITMMHSLGVSVIAFPDGDVVWSLLACMPNSGVDVLYGIGGAPEGVVSAIAIKAMEGNFQGKLILRDQAKGNTPENCLLAEEEMQRCKIMGVSPNKVYGINDLVKSDNLIFSATGITSGGLLKGVTRAKNKATTETIVITNTAETIRKFESVHNLVKKAEYIKPHII